MKFPWVITLAPEDAAVLSPLRLEPELQVAEAQAKLWLRGPAGRDALDARVAALPARERFEVTGNGLLRLVDQRVPSHPLPAVAWQPLGAWLSVALPTAALSGDPPPGIRLRLVRSGEEKEPEVLLTTVTELEAFCRHAPQIRLDRLRFAADDRGQALVWGRPLPPLPGRRFLVQGGVAVAAGFHWSPAVGADVLARRLGGSPDSLVLWHEDETITRLHAEQFLPLTRSSIRATAKAQTRLE